MGLRNSTIRRPRRFKRHNAVVARRRKKVRWLLAQRARVRNYRRFFMVQSELTAKAEASRKGTQKGTQKGAQPDT
ncbi:hypothetical protein JF535_08310 [Microbulbifer salipaludis]|uniref:50S ribosomal protein L20 n=1 Tax=Microbulbifer salipaludis TaxID=187980 RepID=A0ABS3E6D0_9GAMM|nr:hypothetical protein [Microbulbifer salipaludis]MBN8430854.1 hypothetical protein [Microbulbifer salipaludis]